MAIFTGAHLVEFFASVTAALIARAVRVWWVRKHEPSLTPVSEDTRAHLVADDNNDNPDLL
jgi:hypothetical protein